MKAADIARYRLYNQQVADHRFDNPGDLVSWLGIVQAQDYPGAKWSLGLRLPGMTDAGIEAAIADKTIVRSWSFRGTLHFMAPDNIRWMLSLAARRLLSSLGGRLRTLEIDKPVLTRSYAIFERTLAGGKQLTRKELMSALQKKGISTEGLRSNFFMLCAALEGIICLAPRRNKEFTYTLLDEWLSPATKIPRDEALAKLARIYFTSHGPATLHDFAWWSGLTLADAKAGMEMAKPELSPTIAAGQNYWMNRQGPEVKTIKNGVYLLPGFDEYLLGYKDRSIVLAQEHAKQVAGAGNGLFSATIVVNGHVAGTWKRTFSKDTLVMTINRFTVFNKTTERGVTNAANRYGKFMNMPVVIDR